MSFNSNLFTLGNRLTKTIARNININSYCDDNSSDLINQANKSLKEVHKIQTPIQFDNLKSVIQQGTVNTYDGFRLIVQKQVNLNSVVSHFYWLGQANPPVPIYQYRVIIPYDDKILNVVTDLDFNVEGELKYTLTKALLLKSNFTIGEQSNSLNVELEHTDEDSSSLIGLNNTDQQVVSIARMQALTPFLSLGGLGHYNVIQSKLETSFGALYDNKEYVVAGQWDQNLRVMFLRKFNDNRLNLSSEFVLNDKLQTQATVAAEYNLKQSKIHMSIDTDLLIKSTVETSLGSGVTLQLAAQSSTINNQYKFGFGIVMGS
mmetsp:Transcript_7928/g.7081  ORF Transcript_7928/g.7081 Transcript_7928/m.7081 type:complete len:318 (+) Transcript_7928:43-996(+)